MTEIVIDDRLINKARSLIEGETDEAIVTAALEGWIVAKENQINIGANCIGTANLRG
ncbi:MAG: type II toxin-antitoxin system VapB family antitoxin [Treponema sp.]|jgi:hypothetical protein|nr:type II toxin-antitoxin system VapB family antitoxin [Treponema sp.]